MTAHRVFLAMAGLHGAVAVALGAFAAHGLPGASPQALGWLETGARYELIHAAALLGTALLAGSRRSTAAIVAGWAFAFGATLFPAALYGLALGGPRWLGAVAPFGGAALILGWLAVFAAALRRPRD